MTRPFRTAAAFCALALAAALIGITAPPASAGGSSNPLSLVAVGDTLFFVIHVEVIPEQNLCRNELWNSDGTEDETVLVKHIPASDCGDIPGWFTDVDGTLFFTAAHDGGDELWKSDGTEAGTVMVKDINPDGHSFPSSLTDVGGTLFFNADGINGRELWQSDGTEDGTVLVKDINPEGSSRPTWLTDVDGTLFFFADDPLHPPHVGNAGSELWKSDGTEDGTVLVKDINPDPGTAFAGNLANVGGTLFFGADDGINGRELWKSDGTEDGTVLVKDINPGSADSGTAGLTDVAGTLFFVANDGIHGRELWQSDGTEAGTVMVKDIHPDGHAFFGAAGGLTHVAGTLFFVANDGIHGRELWQSDGTEAGTVMVKDIHPDGHAFFGAAGGLTDVAGTLFFRADDGTRGHELWKSDGTEDGTVLVKDIRPGSAGSFPSDLTNAGATLFFGADDGIHGRELWKSDGTEDGTVLVKDIKPIEHPGRIIGLGPRLLRNQGVAQGRVRLAELSPNRPRCFRKVRVRVQRAPLGTRDWRTIRNPRTDTSGLYRTANRILRPDGQPRPGRYRAIALRFRFIAPDGTEVVCNAAVSPVRRVPRR